MYINPNPALTLNPNPPSAGQGPDRELLSGERREQREASVREGRQGVRVLP